MFLKFLRGRMGEYLKGHLQRRAYKKISRHPELLHLISVASPSTGAQYTDYWALYAYIRKYRPQEILELGPGITTLVMAQACAENGQGRITAMEDVEKYFTATRDSIPAHLSQYIDLCLSPSREYRYGPFLGKAYTEIPNRPYEFIYVDGPNYDAATEFDADILEVVGRSSRPLTAFIDSRTGSCFIYHLAFGNKFSFDYLRRMGKVTSVTQKDLRNYKDIVADSMKKRQFRRTFI